MPAIIKSLIILTSFTVCAKKTDHALTTVLIDTVDTFRAIFARRTCTIVDNYKTMQNRLLYNL